MKTEKSIALIEDVLNRTGDTSLIDGIGRTPLEIASEYNLTKDIKEILWKILQTKMKTKQEDLALMAIKNITAGGQMEKDFKDIYKGIHNPCIKDFLFEAAKAGASKAIIQLILRCSRDLRNADNAR